MKKSLFIVALLVMGSLAGKAQSFKIAPIDTSINLSTTLKKLKVDTSWRNYPLKPLASLNQQLVTDATPYFNNNFSITDNSFSSKMPVVDVASTDRMPVLKLGDTENMHYTMKIKSINPKTETQKQRP